MVLNPTSEAIDRVLHVDRITTFNIDSLVDESNLNDPHSYNRMGKRHQIFNKQVSFENIGDEPILGLSIITNNKNLRSFSGIKSYLDLDRNKRRSVLKVFNLWKEVFHASSRLRANDNPYCLLNYWGHGVCSEIAHATAILLRKLGIPWRRMNLYGHWVFEFYFDRKWTIIDPNQLVYYLHFDNRSLASYQEVLKDPLLILRTKAFGKYGSYDVKKSWINFGLYNFIEPITGLDTFVEIDRVEAFKIQDWDLYPTEKITFFHDRPPETKIGNFKQECWTYEKDLVAGDIELVINASLRRKQIEDKTILVNCSYPIYKIINLRTGAVIVIPSEELVTTIELKIEPLDRFFSIFCHGNRNTFPGLVKGLNSLKLSSKNRQGKIEADFKYNLFRTVEIPQITVENSKSEFEYKIPYFRLKSNNNLACEKIWWQIAPDRDFEFIIPNFDCIESFTETVELSAIDETFINNLAPYFFRVKGFYGGIWGEWSQPVQFKAKKPERPKNITCRLQGNDKLTLRWEGSLDLDVRYLVFGSDRYDFIPDIYSKIQVEKSLEQKVTETIENKNLILVTEEKTCTVNYDRCFFRIVAVKNESYSIPSAIIYPAKTSQRATITKPEPTIFAIADCPRIKESDKIINYLGKVVPFTPKEGETPDLEVSKELNYRKKHIFWQSLKALFGG